MPKNSVMSTVPQKPFVGYLFYLDSWFFFLRDEKSSNMTIATGEVSPVERFALLCCFCFNIQYRVYRKTVRTVDKIKY